MGRKGNLLFFEKQEKSTGRTDGSGRDIYKDWGEVHMGVQSEGKWKVRNEGLWVRRRNRNGGAIRDVSLAGEGSADEGQKGTTIHHSNRCCSVQPSRAAFRRRRRQDTSKSSFLRNMFLQHSNFSKNHSGAARFSCLLSNMLHMTHPPSAKLAGYDSPRNKLPNSRIPSMPLLGRAQPVSRA